MRRPRGQSWRVLRRAVGGAPIGRRLLCRPCVDIGRSGLQRWRRSLHRAASRCAGLVFETLRHLGMAQALRWHRANLPAAIDALLCTALALMAPDASAA